MNKVKATFRKDVYIEDSEIIKILEEKLSKILHGGECIVDGFICYVDRYDNYSKMKEVSIEEMELYLHYKAVINDLSK